MWDGFYLSRIDIVLEENCWRVQELMTQQKIIFKNLYAVEKFDRPKN